MRLISTDIPTLPLRLLPRWKGLEQECAYYINVVRQHQSLLTHVCAEATPLRVQNATHTQMMPSCTLVRLFICACVCSRWHIWLAWLDSSQSECKAVAARQRSSRADALMRPDRQAACGKGRDAGTPLQRARNRDSKNKLTKNTGIFGLRKG